jgi:hypothetical protein
LAVRRKKNKKDKKIVSVNRFAICGKFTRALLAHQIFLIIPEIECIHLIFSLLSKASGFDKVVNKIYGTLRQHCKILPGRVFLFFKVYLTFCVRINQADYA